MASGSFALQPSEDSGTTVQSRPRWLPSTIRSQSGTGFYQTQKSAPSRSLSPFYVASLFQLPRPLMGWRSCVGWFTVRSRQSLCSSSRGALLTADLCPRQAVREAATSQGHPSPDAGLFQGQQTEQEVRGGTLWVQTSSEHHRQWLAISEAPWEQS